MLPTNKRCLQRAYRSGGCVTSIITDDPRYYRSSRFAHLFEYFNKQMNKKEVDTAYGETMDRIRKEAANAEHAKGLAAKEVQESKGLFARIGQKIKGIFGK